MFVNKKLIISVESFIKLIPPRHRSRKQLTAIRVLHPQTPRQIQSAKSSDLQTQLTFSPLNQQNPTSIWIQSLLDRPSRPGFGHTISLHLNKNLLQ